MIGLVSVLAAYLLGSIPSAYYAVKWTKGVDLRQVGSGNLGYTNAARVLGFTWAIPVLLFDVIKGIAAVSIARWLVPGQESLAVLSGLIAIVGHSWTLFLGFKGGGKGVATSAGVFAALSPASFAIAIIAFLLTLAISRIMSLASIVLALSLVAGGGFLISIQNPAAPSWEVFAFSTFTAILIIVRHRSNIGRLCRGEEPRLNEKKEKHS